MKMNSDDIKDQLLQKDEKTKRQKDDEQATSNEFTSKEGGGRSVPNIFRLIEHSWD